MTAPDPYSSAWYRQQFQGILHSLNRCNAEYAAADELIQALTTRVTKLEQALFDAQAAIGRLRDEHESDVAKIREAYRQLKNGGAHEG